MSSINFSLFAGEEVMMVPKKEVPEYLYCVEFLHCFKEAIHWSSKCNTTKVPIFPAVRGDARGLTKEQYLKTFCFALAAEKDQIPTLVKDFYNETTHQPLTKLRAIFKIDTSEVEGTFLLKSGYYYFAGDICLEAIVEVKGIESPESTL